MTVERVVQSASPLRGKMVEITGGEPLIQSETPLLCRRLLEGGAVVLVETNGSCDIGVLPRGCIRIMDVKCPSSGMAEKILPENFSRLRRHDEVKFVIANRDDFVWAVERLSLYGLTDRCTVIFSPVFGVLPPGELAEWILSDGVPVRLGIQLHKYIWPHETRAR